MLQKIFDFISFSSNMKENDEFMKNLQMKLRALSIHENIIINAINLKKKFLIFFYLSYVIAFNSWIEYKSMLILISSVIVLSQWKNVILKNFSNLTFIVTHDKSALKYKLKNWMSVVVMKSVSQSLRHWLTKLQYIFNDSMWTVSRIVVLSIYDTFIAWILMKTLIEEDDEEKKS